MNVKSHKFPYIVLLRSSITDIQPVLEILMFYGWNEEQHFQVSVHGSQLEKGVIAFNFQFIMVI